VDFSTVKKSFLDFDLEGFLFFEEAKGFSYDA